MFEIGARMHFDAAHYLRGYSGKCGRLHGHRYVVEAVVAVERLGPSGIAFDFVDLKRLLRAACSELDHTCLNDLPPFQEESPSAEAIARWFYGSLAPEVSEPARLRSVTVWESPECWARYSE